MEIKKIPMATRLEIEDGGIIKGSILKKIADNCCDDGFDVGPEDVEAVLVEAYQLGFCDIET